MSDNLRHPTIYADLFERGLGELPIMRKKGDAVLLGQLVKDKGALVFKDRDVLRGIAPANVAPCWDLGLIGAVADTRGNEWDSLTFLGADLCKILVDLSRTRHDVLGRIVAATGENILTYRGSVYRGFQLMLDASLLPVVIPLPIGTREGVTGLAVTDFRFATVPLKVVLKVNDLVRAAVERHLTLSVEEIDISEEEFGDMFGQFKK